ncbi:MAG: peptidoglycan DD-metalloendopeptidase family protein [Pseudomonadota bacterium]|nr:peptidoglycan DD-metalloendopeptidase family protein [Pseudomonadota bacterium]
MIPGEMSVSRRILRFLSTCFSERQIIWRVGSETRYLRLSPQTQIACVAGWAVLTGLISFHVVGFYIQSNAIKAQSRSIIEAQSAYTTLLDQVSEYQLSVMGVTRDLKETEAHLRRLFSQNEALKQDLMSTESALQMSERERSRITTDSSELGDQLHLLGRELRRMSSKNTALETHINSLRGHLELVKNEKAEIAAERAALDDRLWRLHNDLQGSMARNSQLEGNLDSIKADLRQVLSERRTIISKNTRLGRRVESLEATLAETRTRHAANLERLNEQIHARTDVLESIIQRTGINIDELIPIPNGMLRGQGGPFIPLHPDFFETSEQREADQPIDLRLDDALARWQQVRDVFLSMPVIVPVKNYYVASRFGRRRDPFTRRWARHEGIDLAGPSRQPIFATASGRVAFAGRNGAYGRMVEIDHGHGVVTRYGHLYRAYVKRGDQVMVGQKIAALGNTGRSTGPHVHYEVRYKGKPLDPLKFLRATRHVQ